MYKRQSYTSFIRSEDKKKPGRWGELYPYIKLGDLYVNYNPLSYELENLHEGAFELHILTSRGIYKGLRESDELPIVGKSKIAKFLSDDNWFSRAAASALSFATIFTVGEIMEYDISPISTGDVIADLLGIGFGMLEEYTNDKVTLEYQWYPENSFNRGYKYPGDLLYYVKIIPNDYTIHSFRINFKPKEWAKFYVGVAHTPEGVEKPYKDIGLYFETSSAGYQTFYGDIWGNKNVIYADPGKPDKGLLFYGFEVNFNF